MFTQQTRDDYLSLAVYKASSSEARASQSSLLSAHLAAQPSLF
jgi:hypothetical protein